MHLYSDLSFCFCGSQGGRSVGSALVSRDLDPRLSERTILYRRTCVRRAQTAVSFHRAGCVVLVWLAFKRPKAWVRLLSLFWNVEYSLSLRILFSRQWDIFYWKDSWHYVRIAPVCNTFVSSISGQCSVSLHYFYSASHHPFCVLWEFYSMPQYVLINALTAGVFCGFSLRLLPCPHRSHPRFFRHLLVCSHTEFLCSCSPLYSLLLNCSSLQSSVFFEVSFLVVLESFSEFSNNFRSILIYQNTAVHFFAVFLVVRNIS